VLLVFIALATITEEELNGIDEIEGINSGMMKNPLLA
jgi:hypothetical protein